MTVLPSPREAGQTETIASLSARIVQQQAMIDALVDAAERRLDRPSEDSAFGRWERNVVLHREVEARIQRIGAAEQLLRSVLDSMDARMCVLGADGEIIGTNRLWVQLADRLGWGGGQAAIGADFFALATDLGRELDRSLSDAVRGVLDGALTEGNLRGHLRLAGHEEDIVVRIRPVLDHAQAQAVVSIVDITAATQTQRELRRITEQAQLLALVAEHTDNAVVICDVSGRIEWANRAFCKINGYELDEVTGLRRRDLMQKPYTRTPAFREFEDALATGRSADVQFPTGKKDGSSYWVHLQVQPIFEDGELVRFVSVERDITSQRGAVEQLRAATRQAGVLAEELSAEKSLLTDVLGSIPHLVYWKDSALRYTGVNQAFLAFRGFGAEDDVLERTEAELQAADELSASLTRIEPQVLETGQPVENQRLLLSTPGRAACSLLLSVLPQRDDEGRVRGVIGVAADVTHISTLEQQVAQATRLESIGQLAAGIAHEINTPVQYVSDNTRFLTETFGEVLLALQEIDQLASETGAAAAVPPTTPDRLREILTGVDLDYLAEEIPSALAQSKEGLARVTQIVRAMKDFSHPGQGRIEADLNRAVESTAQVSRNEWRYVAELDLELDASLGLLPCYEGELKQVLLNIVVNAAHAIDAERVRTGSQELGHIRIRTEQLPTGARITVSDDGPGMDETVQRKIFDPFFTTKPVGKGTGQGLSMAYAVIVQKHGGTLSVNSAPGAGATFTIELPADPPS